MVCTQLEQLFKEALEELGYDTSIAKVILSNRPDLCDYQFDGVFKLASMVHQNPIMIGEAIVSQINKRPDFEQYLEAIEFVKPGFINMKLSSHFICRCLNKMMQEEKFGLPQPIHIDTYVLDYGGPNIAKPLHVGHLRSAIVGESIKRIIQFVGHKTISDVHLGDYGLQIGQVIYGLMEQGIRPAQITLEMLETIYPKMSGLCKENAELKEKCAQITKDLQDGVEKYIPYWQKICEVSGHDILRLYRYLDVHFDYWYGESDAYPYISSVQKLLEEKKLLYESEGAKVVDVCEEQDDKELPPFIFQKSNGAYLYATADLATIYQRINDFHPNYILYFTDNRQGLHFEQVFRVAKKMGLMQQDQLEYLPFGTVNGPDGKPYKTRKGDAPKLDDLFAEVKERFVASKESNKMMSLEDQDKIVNAIIKFADLQNNREKDYIFDVNKFSDVVGKTGPYILYTYLRIQKIIDNEKSIDNCTENIYNDQDRNLRLKLLEMDNAVMNAFKNRLSSVIATYVYELCVELNTFYQNNHIQGLEDEKKKENWLYVLTLANKVVKQMLDLLVIQIPTAM